TGCACCAEPYQQTDPSNPPNDPRGPAMPGRGGRLAFYVFPAGELVFAVAALALVDAADGLLLLDAANFALRDKPALVAELAQQAAAHDLLLEALEELLLRFVGSQGH